MTHKHHKRKLYLNKVPGRDVFLELYSRLDMEVYKAFIELELVGSK